MVVCDTILSKAEISLSGAKETLCVKKVLLFRAEVLLSRADIGLLRANTMLSGAELSIFSVNIEYVILDTNLWAYWVLGMILWVKIVDE